MKKTIVYRKIAENFKKIEKLCDHELLETIYLFRGIQSKAELEKDLAQLSPYQQLKDIEKATIRLFQAISNDEQIVIIGDYDTDGATSTAIAVRALNMLGAKRVNYLVPNRFEYGYGLSPEIVQLAYQQFKPNLIITVDNGIVSIEGVSVAKQLGIEVIITDHHLAGEKTPEACAIINPNQPGDNFASKCLAGCGVIFYVMLALRATLREKNWFAEQNIPEPNMANLLDLVALGTVADVVPLDKTNRILVHYGLQRIRQQKCIPGIKVLLEIGKRKLPQIVATDLAYAVAPRLNAAGRLEDMSLGVACLLSDNEVQASKLAFELDKLNNERRIIEATMKTQAFNELDRLHLHEQQGHLKAICLYDSNWHQGVIGILASRIKDFYHKPAVIFAKGDKGELKGSARSVASFHIRDAFERIAMHHPSLIKKFGGHAMAAGLTIAEDQFKIFKEALLRDVEEELTKEDLEDQILCDGELQSKDFTLNFAQAIREAGPWGQGFPEPTFVNRFKIIEQRLIADKHLKLMLALNDKILNGVFFNVDSNIWPNARCEYVAAVYRLDVNEYQGRQNLQLMIDYLEPA
ncbi:MAG: single-stranded-DNA-specific exonuclease RecJ [Gammaproteobacteria bacterium RIFCSPHIGHO2_12_FULL_35_23]|nr:MAG: single-stranded-DNA-specific exonuclease RecJ [Gammaproteobacteria bacterium RIFCSPHIGHO2_12_FULL_35_23]